MTTELRPEQTRVHLLRTVRLHGQLAERFGAEHRIAATSLGEISRALQMRRPGFHPFLREQNDALAYRVLIGEREIGPHQVYEQLGHARTIDLVPVATGAGAGGGTTGGGGALLIIGIILVVIGGPILGPLGVGLIVAGVGAIAQGIAILLAPGPKTPKAQKPGYGFGGVENSITIGDTTPIVFGECFAGSNVVSFGMLSAHTMSAAELLAASQPGPFRGPAYGEVNNAWTDQEARVIDLISMDEIEGFPNGIPEDIYYDDVPKKRLQNAQVNAMYVDWRPGSGDQTPMDGFDYSMSTTQVGKQLKLGIAMVASTSGVIKPATIRANITVSQLFKTDPKKGQRGLGLGYQIRIVDANGVLQHLDHRSIQAKILNRRNYSHEYPVTGTPPYTVSVIMDFGFDSDGEHTTNAVFESISEIGAVRMNFPHAAIVGHKLMASGFGGTLPRRKYFVRGVKVRVPTNYNSTTRQYTGDWDGTFKSTRAYTNNTIWLLLESLTNDLWGIGRLVRDEDINLWSFYRAAQYADEMVSDGSPTGLEPRFTFNAQLTNSQEAWRFILDASGAALSNAFWNGDQLALTTDRPSDPVALFNPANVTGGMFVYSGAELNSRINQLVIRYRRNDLQGEVDTILLEDRPSIRKIGLRQEAVDAVGVTSRQQAVRYGTWRLLTEGLKDGVRFETGLEALALQPGSVIQVEDPRRWAMRSAGRVISATSTVATLDRAVTLETGKSYELSLMLDAREELLTRLANASDVVLQGPLANNDYRRVRVQVDSTGNGDWVSREPNGWNVNTKTLTLVPDALLPGASRPWRIEYPTGYHVSAVSNAAGEHTQLTLATPLPADVTGPAAWILNDAATTPKHYRVVVIKSAEPGRYEVEAIPHDPSIYATIDAGSVISEPDPDLVPPSLIGVTPLPPTGLTLTIVNELIDGRLQPGLRITWLPPLGDGPDATAIIGYRLTWTFFGDPFREPDLLTETTYFLPTPEFGVYEVSVVSEQAFTHKLSERLTNVAIVNADTVPRVQAKITGLRVSERVDNQWVGSELKLEWRINIEGFEGLEDADLDRVGVALSQPDLFDSYEVTLYDASDPLLPVLRKERMRANTFTYTLDMNVEDGGEGDAIDDVIVEVAVWDHLGRPSESSRIHCNNPPPELPTLLEAIGVGTAIQFKFQYDSTDPDLEGMVIWIADDPADLTDALLPSRVPDYQGATRGFLSVPVTPMAGEDDGVTPPVNPLWYFRYACYDAFQLRDIERLFVSGVQGVAVTEPVGNLVIKAAHIDVANLNHVWVGVLEGSVIKAGSISADVIGVGTLRADQLVLGQMDNLIQDGGFETNRTDLFTTVSGNGTWTITTANVRTGLYALRYNTMNQNADAIFTPNSINAGQAFGFPQAPQGHFFYFEAWVRRVTGTGANVQLELEFRTAAHNVVSTATSFLGGDVDVYERVFVTAQVPSGAAYVVPRIRIKNLSPKASFYQIDDLYMRRQVTGAVIEAGAVTNRLVDIVSPSLSAPMPVHRGADGTTALSAQFDPRYPSHAQLNLGYSLDGVGSNPGTPLYKWWKIHDTTFIPRGTSMVKVRCRGWLNLISFISAHFSTLQEGTSVNHLSFVPLFVNGIEVARSFGMYFWGSDSYGNLGSHMYRPGQWGIPHTASTATCLGGPVNDPSSHTHINRMGRTRSDDMLAPLGLDPIFNQAAYLDGKNYWAALSIKTLKWNPTFTGFLATTESHMQGKGEPGYELRYEFLSLPGVAYPMQVYYCLGYGYNPGALGGEPAERVNENPWAIFRDCTLEIEEVLK